MIGVSAIIVFVNIAVFYFIGWRYEAHVREGLTDTARSFYKLIVVMRAWVAQHNGVYVIGDGGVEPNPYLPMTGLRSERGDSLMLRNPALVTRELSTLSQMMGKRFRFHITSLDPINPANAPDDFEREALQRVTSGRRADLTRYGEFSRLEEIDGKRYFRYFAPLYTEESCLSCHAQQGYRVGDVRGGISILMPTDKTDAAKQQNYLLLILGCILASVAICLLVYYLLRGTVIRPLRKLEGAAERIGEGHYDTDIPEGNEDEIGDLGRTMNKMQRAIREYTSKQIETEKVFALGQLSAGIAHEIRNPLFAIRNDLDYLKRHSDDDNHHLEIYDEMEDGLERIDQTVKAVLDYSKPHEPEFGSHHIDEVLDRCMALLGKQLERDRIEIERKVENGLPAIEMDAHRIEQVFVNILTNAMQAINGKRGKIVIGAQRVGEFVNIRITDNGAGIKSTDLQRIFDPFFTRSPNGTGLGLTIVRSIIDKHHGKIRVHSVEGQGATFSIQLPIKQNMNDSE